MAKKFWEFKNLVEHESADLYIYNEISSWNDEEVTSAQSFRDDLESIGEVKNINLYINSPGGSVSDGIAIASMLKRNKAFVTAQVDGLACSIASVIACSADKVVMRSNCMMMIHNALAGGFMYDNAKGYRKLADDLDKISESLKMTYIEKSNGKLTEEKLTELMDAESWLSSKECVELGLCDEIIGSNKAVASISNKFKGFFNNVPENVVVEDESDTDKTEEDKNEDINVEDEDGQPTENDEASGDSVEDSQSKEDELILKLEEATNEIIRLNEVVAGMESKMSDMQVIVDKYNEIQAQEDERKYQEELSNKTKFYKEKFENLGALDKFDSEEVQILLSNCVRDKEALLTLNLMVVDLIDTSKTKSATNVVKKNLVEKISKIENLIPTSEDVGYKYGFK